MSSLPPPDQKSPRELLLKENEIDFDFTLGSEHPKKKAFLALINESYEERMPLNADIMAGKISPKDYMEKLTELITKSQEKFALLLNEEEYKALFSADKNQNFAAALGLQNSTQSTDAKELIDTEKYDIINGQEGLKILPKTNPK